MATDRYLTVKEAQAILPLCAESYRRLARKGAIPHARVLGKLFFPEQAFRQWGERRTHPGNGKISKAA